MVHSLHIVSFHTGDSFSNTEAEHRFDYYSITGIPCHVYDGSYQKATGYINEYKINASGERPIHMLEMSLSKSIDSSTLSFSGSVINLESHSFSGFVLVFITENQLEDPTYGITWSFVFRAYGLNKTISLAGLSTDAFSGTWSIPKDVNASNIQVIAAVYDIDARDPTYGWPYAVQSVCDICGHSVAIPEFPGIWAYLLVFTLTYMTVILLSCKQKSWHKFHEKDQKRDDCVANTCETSFCR